MHHVNNTAERIVDATFWCEPSIVDGGSSIEASTQTADRPRVTLEMAIEWAHLGGD